MLGGIEISGTTKSGFARINKLTVNISEALLNAEVIMVAVTAMRHKEIIELVAPHLRDNQTILIGPDNGGTLIFSNYLKSMALFSILWIW